MATYYFRTVNGNWGDAANWSLTSGGGSTGAVPGTADLAYFDSASGNCTVEAVQPQFTTLSFRGAGSSNYSGTITFTAGLTFSGNVTLSPSMTISGSGNLQSTSACTFTSNGKTWPNSFIKTGGNLTIADTTTFSSIFRSDIAMTITLQANLFTGTFSYSTVTGGNILTLSTGVYTFSTTDFYVGNASNTLSTYPQLSSGRIVVTGTYSSGVFGAVNSAYFLGTGTVSMKSGSTIIANPNINNRIALEVEDGVTLAATYSFGFTSFLLRYLPDNSVPGTISMINGSSFNFSESPVTFNTNKLFIPRISQNISATITQQSDINCGTFSLLTSGSGAASLTLTNGVYTFNTRDLYVGNSSNTTSFYPQLNTGRIIVTGTYSSGVLGAVNSAYFLGSGTVSMKSGSTIIGNPNMRNRIALEVEDGVTLASTYSIGEVSFRLRYIPDNSVPGTLSMINGASFNFSESPVTFNTNKLFIPRIVQNISATITQQSDINCGTFSFLTSGSGGQTTTITNSGYTFSTIDFNVGNASNTLVGGFPTISTGRIVVTGTYSSGDITGPSTTAIVYGSGIIYLKKGSTVLQQNSFSSRIAIEIEDGVTFGTTFSMDTANSGGTWVNLKYVPDKTVPGTVSLINGSAIRPITTIWDTGVLYIPNLSTAASSNITMQSNTNFGTFSHGGVATSLTIGGPWNMNMENFIMNGSGVYPSLARSSAVTVSTFSVSKLLYINTTSTDITRSNNPIVYLKSGSTWQQTGTTRPRFDLVIDDGVTISGVVYKASGVTSYIGTNPNSVITQNSTLTIAEFGSETITFNTGLLNWFNVTLNFGFTLLSDFYFTGTFSNSSYTITGASYKIWGKNSQTGTYTGNLSFTSISNAINIKGMEVLNLIAGNGTSNNVQVTSTTGATISVWGNFNLNIPYGGGVSGILYTGAGSANYCWFELKPGSTYSELFSTCALRSPMIINGGSWIASTMSFTSNGESTLTIRYLEGTGLVNHTPGSLLNPLNTIYLNTGTMNWYSINLVQNVIVVTSTALKITGTLSVTSTSFTITGPAGLTVSFVDYPQVGYGGIRQTVAYNYSSIYSDSRGYINLGNYSVGSGTSTINLVNPVNVYGILNVGGLDGTTGIITGATSGTVSLYPGSTWGPHTGTYQLRNHVYIYGGSSLTGNIYYNTGTISWIGDSNISPGNSTLNISTANTFLNTGNMTWNNITTANITVNLRSDLVALGTLSASASTFTASGNTFSIGGGLTLNSTTNTFTNTDVVMTGTGTITSGTVSGPAFRINSLGLVSLRGTINLPTTTTQYVKGKIDPIGSTLSFPTSGVTILGFHQVPLDVVSITNNITLNMDQFFRGSPDYYASIKPTSATGTYSIAFADGFEKITRFIRIAGCQVQRNNLVVVTPGANKSGTLQGGLNTGIRWINVHPFGAPKNLPNVTESFDSGQLNQMVPNSSDPNFKKSKGDPFNL